MAVPPLTVNAFDNSTHVLSRAQKLQLNKLGMQLRAGDSVSCVAYQQSNALNLVSRLTVKRSQSVCTYLLARVRGLVATPSTQFFPSFGQPGAQGGGHHQTRFVNPGAAVAERLFP
jgi:hypothetical protein